MYTIQYRKTPTFVEGTTAYETSHVVYKTGSVIALGSTTYR